jgi:hypothetical protein
MATLSELTLGIFKNADEMFDALHAELVLSDHPHPRARVRRWIVDRLKAAALLPAKIVSNRATPTALSDAPVVLVYLLGEEDPEPFNVSPLTYSRPATLALHAIVPELDLPEGVDLDEVADAFAYVFESMLLCDIDSHGLYFGAQAADCVPRQTEFVLEDKGERVYLHARTEWRITYQTTPASPATDPLAVVHADWDVGPTPDEQLEAEDTVSIPQE